MIKIDRTLIIITKDRLEECHKVVSEYLKGFREKDNIIIHHYIYKSPLELMEDWDNINTLSLLGILVVDVSISVDAYRKLYTHIDSIVTRPVYFYFITGTDYEDIQRIKYVNGARRLPMIKAFVDIGARISGNNILATGLIKVLGQLFKNRLSEYNGHMIRDNSRIEEDNMRELNVKNYEKLRTTLSEVNPVVTEFSYTEEIVMISIALSAIGKMYDTLELTIDFDRAYNILSKTKYQKVRAWFIEYGFTHTKPKVDLSDFDGIYKDILVYYFSNDEIFDLL